MKKKQKSFIPILFAVLIAAFAGLGYYYYSESRTTAPSGKNQPQAEIEKIDGYHLAESKTAEPEPLKSEQAKTAETKHHQSPSPAVSSDGASSPESLENQEKAKLKKPSPHEEQKEPTMVSGRIKPPASPQTRNTGPGPAARSTNQSIDFAPYSGGEGQKPGDDGFCRSIESEFHDVLSYLEDQDYIPPLDSKTDMVDRFNQLTTALSANPPEPAGESLDPAVLFKNIYHVYRIMNIKDIKMLKNIIRYEREDLEFYMQMVYRWLSSSDECQDNILDRPPQKIVYSYAGFFLNTTGGRAILFRRDPILRILSTYYCVLIIHEADREKRNVYGIDILPFIPSLRKEIYYHPELIFRDQYLSVLDEIALYYQENR